MLKQTTAQTILRKTLLNADTHTGTAKDAKVFLDSP